MPHQSLIHSIEQILPLTPGQKAILKEAFHTAEVKKKEVLLKEGEITKGQAAALHKEDRSIRTEEKTMAGLDNGHITKADQRALNQQENAVSKQIGK